MEKIHKIVESFFGADPDLLTLWQMAKRAIVIYILGIIILRFHKRFMNIRTTNNFFLYIMTGSILAASIVGMIDFFHSLGAVIIIMGINVFTSMLIFYFPSLERFIRGERVILVDKGDINWKAMKQNLITYQELMDAIHHANIDNLKDTQRVYFETSGRINVILKQ